MQKNPEQAERETAVYEVKTLSFQQTNWQLEILISNSKLMAQIQNTEPGSR